MTKSLVQEHLFEPPAQVKLTLADKFLVPPFSVLDTRAGYWQERKREWLGLGIKSELGREGNLLNMSETVLSQWGPGAESAQARTKREELEASIAASRGEAAPAAERPQGVIEGYGGDGKQAWGGAGTSVFDPVLCELAYRWFAPEGGLVLDPFAGGSVRGIVAAHLGRQYLGVDLRPEQVESNVEQARKIGAAHGWPHPPAWLCGDSLHVLPSLPAESADFVFSCPPYYDLEQYSDDPADLSNLGSYELFLEAYRAIIRRAFSALKPDRFACFVVGDVRSKKGPYLGFVPDTIRAFEQAGFEYYNEAILVTSVGSLPIRTSRLFIPGRKLGKTHQNVLGFVKGDWRKAAAACPMPPEVAVEMGGAVWTASGEVSVEGEREELFEGEEPS